MLGQRPIQPQARSWRRFMRPAPTPSNRRAYTRVLSTAGRSNPTRFAFERCVADLEDGKAEFAFASGMAAIATVQWNCWTTARTCSCATISMAALSGCSSGSAAA